MERVHLVGAGQDTGGTEVPSGVQGRSPSRGSEGAEAKCEISIQFLTFFCTKFRI